MARTATLTSWPSSSTASPRASASTDAAYCSGAVSSGSAAHVACDAQTQEESKRKRTP
jgi:hypothetical protein